MTSKRTNITIDADLLKEALELTSLKTKEEVINLALQELKKQLRRRALLQIRRPGLWQGNLAEIRRSRVEDFGKVKKR